MLQWAREEAGYTQEEAAHLMDVSTAKLRAWEMPGAIQPTLRQAERLAKICDFAFSIFSLPAPPQLPALATEYRRLPGVRPGAEAPELRRVVKRLVYRRRVALHLYAELGDDPPEFSFRPTLSEDAETVGQGLRQALSVSLSEQFGWSSEFVAYRTWRAGVEGMGILVSQFPGKGVPDVRGTSIVHFPLPVVALNSKELPLSKPFTLLHEVVHLGLVASDEEKPALDERRDEPSWLEVERFCEAAAGAALMPADALLADEDVVSQKRARSWDVHQMRQTARRFRVTPTAAATRLLRLGAMTPRAYAAWKESWQAYRDAHPEKPGFGRSTPAERAVGRNGPLFTSLVLSALSNDRITSTNASHYLDLGFAHVEDLRRSWIDAPLAFASAIAD